MSYEFLDLGTLGGSSSSAAAASADGSVVVGKARISSGSDRAFRWTEATGMVDLGVLPSAFFSEALGVSADGSVVVGVSSGMAFRWTESGGMVNLGTLGGTEAKAFAVSSDGLVVVGAADAADGFDRAFRWTEAGGMVDLGVGAGSSALAVSPDGSIVVGAAPGGKAFRWTQATGFELIGTLGGSSASAKGVSSDGVVVGSSNISTGDTHAFRWTQVDGMTDLGTLGGSYSVAYGVSSDGSKIIGESYNASSSSRAFVWSSADSMVSLGSEDTSIAYGVSGDGAVVVGVMVVGGLVHAFRASAPTPAPPPPPPNNSAPIEFEPLVSSPETLAEDDTTLSLPRLQAYGKEVPGNYGTVSLPLFSALAAGVTQDNVYGAGFTTLPSLSAGGTNRTVGRLVDVTGYSTFRLPAIVVSARDGSDLIPQSGWGDIVLPLFSSVAAGGEGLRGASSLSLPALQGFALQADGAYGVATLPHVQAIGRETYAMPENRMLLVQPAGAMAIMAGNTYTVVRDETAAFDSAPFAAAVSVLREQIALNTAPNPAVSSSGVLSDDVAFYDALGVAWKLLLQEEVALIGAATATPTRLASVIDTLNATGVVSPRTDAVVVVASAIALNSLLAAGWRETAADTVAFQDALGNAVRIATQLAETAGFADVATPQIRMTAVVTDEIVIEGDAAATMNLLAQMEDSVLFHAALRFGDDEYVGWVLNEGAPSQYTNYPFNGFSPFGHRYIGTADDGIYLLEGDDDAGEPIEAHIKTALMDFGNGVNKRLPDVYVAFAGGNKLVCKVVTSHPRTGQKIESVYETTIPPGAEMHNGRIKLGQGLESRYWQFTLSNVDGAGFDLDELTFRPLFLDRRL